ncbi:MULTISPECIES: extracellular solute-binding protein [Thermoactinomyces]|jgi:multiple sugar transport system substrate-binding protein|uniref:Extracellular solute-binding protein n=1 Tax=Thermoactinomyces daqus TaxID=1329516 RepID=A0A7W1X8S6_9BACL|nr:MULTISPECIES: extracellular solute-binding protein [Thermoactinomyces]MBA4542200.1 extracellular solute-binding protein [Thermoactinomyces daqus]MBH8598349.1 extracellular solute-binding protein [Thermoactinomyces sp. CICC 10523]MBH8604473.1 extracellular solute-binding protein [Thermoactinomyces sp. CICC 10522]MBH8607526.1 extracellular solute-binding protein [Thermoactinomyces sp. CICC 10521]
MRREKEFRYLKLANILREQILSGYIKPGEFLLSENELCKFYGLSRTSVRKSLDELLKEGLIVKKPGQGTMVSPDLEITEKQRRILRILAPSPSFFVDNGLPVIIERFLQEHPHVDVKVLSLPSFYFWESLRTSREMGLDPDLVFVSDRQFAEMDNLDSFADLEPLLANRIPAMYPKVIQAFRRQKEIKAAPVTFSTVYLAYNPELFRRYGVPEPASAWTQSEFVNAAKKMTRDTNGDGIIDLYGISLSSSFSRWPVFALQKGISPTNPAEHPERLVETFDFLHDLLYRDRVATIHQTETHHPNSDAFVRGKTAMVLTTTLEMAGWRSEQMDFEPQVAPLPFGDNQATLLLANMLIVPTACKSADLAKEFISTALRSDVQEKMSRTAHFLSVLKHVNEQVWDRPFLESINITNRQVENSYFLHELFPDAGVMEELETEMKLFWAGLESAASFAQTLQRMIRVKSKS